MKPNPRLSELPHFRRSPMDCPACGDPTNCDSNASGNRQPKPGDPAICFNCGELLEFDSQRKFVPITPECRADMEKTQPEDWAALLDYQSKIKKRGLKRVHPE